MPFVIGPLAFARGRAYASLVETTIVGFHQDEVGDWVAELACGHGQHMRHRPPWQERPWVVTEAGRRTKLGAVIDCPLCDASRPPRGARE